MKKNFKYFGIVWLVGFILFNAITFLIPNEVFGETRFDKDVFWIAYALIVLSFIAQLITAYKFIKDDSADKTFLHIPLLQTGYAAVIVSAIVGLIFMIFPVLPAWVGAIVCLLVAGYFIIACINASTVANVVADIDGKVKTQTAFIKNAIIDSANLVARATTHEIRLECQRIYDAFCYSDPVSNKAVLEIENLIADYMREMTFAVSNANYGEVKIVSEKLLNAIRERNKECKANK